MNCGLHKEIYQASRSGYFLASKISCLNSDGHLERLIWLSSVADPDTFHFRLPDPFQ